MLTSTAATDDSVCRVCIGDVHLKSHNIEDGKLLELYEKLTGAKVCC